MSDKLREALTGLLAIVDESEGVAGYHLNGEIAEWDTFAEVDAAREALAEAQPAQQSQWVPVSVRLPSEDQGTVAVLFDDGHPGVAWATYWHGARTDFAQWTFPLDDLGDGREVTHWMPLPSAPGDTAAPKQASLDCDYHGSHFGAVYPDAQCIDGYLWDEDSCDEPGGPLSVGGDIPCPKCNAAEYAEYLREDGDGEAPGQAEQPKCNVCSDVGIIGHSDICPACSDSWQPPTERAAQHPKQPDEEANRLHWYAFSFSGSTPDFRNAEASTYMGWPDKAVTKPRIEHAKKASGINPGAVLISCSYLGRMTKAQMVGGE